MSFARPGLNFFAAPQPGEPQPVPQSYRHWHLTIAGRIATLAMDVQPDAGIFDGYELKLNSYDIGVDMELAHAVRHIRFSQPEVSCVVITSQLDGVFCAGANIGMLACVDHAHKINFCKFTNETRLEMEEASNSSGIKFLAAINGACSGGGYELALACDYIVLIDDRSTAVSLPEVPLLGVLPGTGGLTRLTDKRGVRRDLVDVFATRSEGCRGDEALRWGLVDELVPRSTFDEVVAARAGELARGGRSAQDGQPTSEPVQLPELAPNIVGRNVSLEFVALAALPDKGLAEVLISASDSPHWLLQTALELDAVLCHLRFNEPELGTLVISTAGGPAEAAALRACDRSLTSPANHVELETALLWARTLRRLDLMQRSLFATIEPDSCCVGVLAELALAADRTYMLEGAFVDARPPDSVGLSAKALAATALAAPASGKATASTQASGKATASTQAAIWLTEANLGALTMSNGISRLQSRLWGNPDRFKAAQAAAATGTKIGTEPGTKLNTAAAAELGLVTATPDDLDWDDELRLAIEERASFSGDALTGLEANQRFCGPETMATKIFGRLSAWQNWIFSRPNATGPNGALQRYGSGARPEYDPQRT